MASFLGTQINPKSFHRSQFKFYALLVPLSIFMILPVIYVVSQAFKPLSELFLFPPRFFVENPTLENFARLFRTASGTGVPMTRYLFNSIIITTLTIFLTILITLMTGYALSKKRFKAKKALFSINQTALMFVATAVAIPRYIVVTGLGLSNNFFAHIIPYLAMPVGLFLVKQFIDQVPDELIEAAKIDGANDWHILTKIVGPLVKPALATVAILSFQFIWNSTESSAIYIIDETKKTFAFYMATLTSSTAGPAGVGISAAAGLVMFLPNLIIFVVMQSNVMDTMSHSGIK
ncbi:MAG: carbohydrate ABC transporter permease [bacterium]|jgi:ABC-type glycerol-3-phosphate transport system permease component|nr:carbohydrate ABC transporter permease [bacterium]